MELRFYSTFLFCRPLKALYNTHQIHTLIAEAARAIWVMASCSSDLPITRQPGELQTPLSSFVSFSGSGRHISFYLWTELN